MKIRVVCASVVMVCLAALGVAQQASVSSGSAAVPNVVNYSGVLTDLDGKPAIGIQGVTFLLYSAQHGGVPLWLETQNVTPAENGQYAATLGITKSTGLPADLFTSGEARWLAVQVAGQPEQPRVLLVAVPYAMEAADAQTIGGLPPSAFVLANSPQAVASQNHANAAPATLPTAASKSPAPANPAVTGLGAPGFIPAWDATSDIVNSIMFQRAGQIGIGLTTPVAMLDVNGKGNFRDTLTLIPKTTDSTLAVKGSAFTISNTGKVTFVTGQPFPGTAQLAANNTFTGIQTINNAAVISAGTASGALQATNTLSTGATAGVFGQALSGAGYGVEGVGGTGVLGSSSVCTAGPNAGCPGGSFSGFNAASLDNQPGGDGVDALGGSGGLDVSGGNGIVGTGGNASVVGGAVGGFGVVGFGGTGSVSSGDGVGGSFTGGNLTLFGDGIDAFAGTGEAGTFLGNIFVTGSITAGVKDFKIDHPLDPANKYLVHASIESSEMINIYSGNITTDAQGYADVRLPDWFEAVNTNFRYQLTVIGQFAQAIIGRKIQNHSFQIRTNAPNVEVSWQVTGERQDAFAKAHPLRVEEEKTARLKGYYLHPELYGAPSEKQIEWARHPQMMKRVQQQKATQQQTRAASAGTGAVAR